MYLKEKCEGHRFNVHIFMVVLLTFLCRPTDKNAGFKGRNRKDAIFTAEIVTELFEEEEDLRPY